MFCLICFDFLEKLSDIFCFISDCSNFRMEFLRSYVKLIGYIWVEEVICVKVNFRNVFLLRIFFFVLDEVRLKIEKLFDIVYMIVKFEFFFIIFLSLCVLEKKKKIWSLFRKYVLN